MYFHWQHYFTQPYPRTNYSKRMCFKKCFSFEISKFTHANNVVRLCETAAYFLVIL